MSEEGRASIFNVSKGKICRNIKGREYGVRRKQHKYLTKDETSAPPVATEALLLTCIIYAMGHREVSTVDIPGSFMQADMEGDTVHMKIEG